MNLLRQLSALALCQLMGERAESVLGFLEDRFSDRSQRVSAALCVANERAWRSLEVALAGPSWWQRARSLLAAREEQVFRDQVQAFLRAVPEGERGAPDADFRRRCLEELRAAREARLVPGEDLAVDDAARQARAFARYADPARLVGVQLEAVGGLADDLQRAGYPHLGQYVALRPAGEAPLLLTAVRYFFRREVEADPKLSAGLTFQQLEGLGGQVEAGLRGLHDALARSGGRLEQLLGGVHGLLADTHEDVRAVRAEVEGLRRLLEEDARRPEREVEAGADVRAMRAELERQGRQIQDLYQALLRALEQQRQAPTEVRENAAPAPAPGLTGARTATPPPEGSAGWGAVRQLLEQCRALPQERRRALPELFHTAGQLEEAASAFEATRRTYQRLTDGPALVPAPAEPAGPTHIPPLPPRRADEGSVPGARPTLRRIEGPLVSELFLGPSAGEAVPPAAETTPAAQPRSRGRALSPLFEQSSQPPPEVVGQGGTPDEGQAPPPDEAPAPPPAGKVRRRGLSPLFGDPGPGGPDAAP